MLVLTWASDRAMPSTNAEDLRSDAVGGLDMEAPVEVEAGAGASAAAQSAEGPSVRLFDGEFGAPATVKSRRTSDSEARCSWWRSGCSTCKNQQSGHVMQRETNGTAQIVLAPPGRMGDGCVPRDETRRICAKKLCMQSAHRTTRTRARALLQRMVCSNNWLHLPGQKKSHALVHIAAAMACSSPKNRNGAAGYGTS